MVDVSVVKKLERCERIGPARLGDAAPPLLHADRYQVIKYTIQIKEFLAGPNPPPCTLLQLLRHSPASSPSTLHPLHHLHNPHDPPLHTLLTHHNYSPPRSATPPLPLHDHPLPQENAPASPYISQKAAVEDETQLGDRDDDRHGTRSPWKLRNDVVEKAVGAVYLDGVKKMECECCGMEEECTAGYEERVRERLWGHWLCGLCEEAVGEERKRVGGSVQAALAAHMQPCRRFSRRVRSKASPPGADVGVPHAVCRLLCRHLSTPASRHRTSASTGLSLSRSSSCLPSLATTK